MAAADYDIPSERVVQNFRATHTELRAQDIKSLDNPHSAPLQVQDGGTAGELSLPAEEGGKPVYDRTIDYGADGNNLETHIFSTNCNLAGYQ